MKQILITMAVAALGFTTANAQRLDLSGKLQAKNKMEMATKTMKVAQAPVFKKSNEELTIYSTDRLVPFKAPFKAEGEDPELEAWYEIPEGSLYWAMSSEWRYYPAPILQTPAWLDQKFFNTTYYNDSTTEVTYKWTVMTDEENEMDQDEDHNGIISGWGYYMAPKITATQGNLVSEHQLQGTDDEETVDGYWYAGTDTILSLSHATYSLGFYGGFSDMEDRFAANTLFEGKKVTGFAEQYEAMEDTVYATSLYILGWLEETDNLTTPLGDNELKAEIFLINEDGSLSEEPYATAYATNDEVDVVYEEYGNTTIRFPFVEEDPIFGYVESAVIMPRQDYIIKFSGFENLEGVFTVPFSSAYDGGPFVVAGHSYVLLEDGTFSTIGYRRYPNVPQVNLYIGIEAAIPVAKLLEEDLVVEFPEQPDDGDEVVMGITGIDPDDGESYGEIYVRTGTPFPEDGDESNAWMVSGAEWVTGFYADNTFFDQYNVVTFYLFAEPLPEGVEGRSGEIIFSVYGKEVKVPVKQGKVAEAIKGDVNLDGSVDVADISAILSQMAGTASYNMADVNKDGEVDVADISTVLSIMAGTSE